MTFQLQSHESSKNGVDLDIKYTVLEDGKPLGFSEHCAVIARANAYAKLVEALADVMRDQLKTVNLHQMAPGPRQRIERARALLIDLGEQS